MGCGASESGGKYHSSAGRSQPAAALQAVYLQGAQPASALDCPDWLLYLERPTTTQLAITYITLKA